MRSNAIHSTEARLSGRQVSWLPIEAIAPNPRQPRKTFDPHALGELAASIRQVGLLQPITVRAMGPGAYELVAGERRLRACQTIGMTHIDAIVVSARDGDSALLALIENLQREDLHYFEEAEGYAMVLRVHCLSQEELAMRVGRSQSAIANKLRLLKLEGPVREALRVSALTERHARALLRIPDAQRQMEALTHIVKHGLNVRQADAWIASMLQGQAEYPKQRHVVSLVRDHRLYINAIRDIVAKMRATGVEAKVDVTEQRDFVETHVRMPRKCL